MNWLSRCCIRPPATRDDDVTPHDVAPAIVPSAPRVDATHQQPPTELDSSVDWASFPHEIKVAILAQLPPTTLLQMRPPSGTLAAACVRAGIYDIPPGPEGDGRARAALALRAGVGTWGCGTPKDISLPPLPASSMCTHASFGERHVAAASGKVGTDGVAEKIIWLYDRRSNAWQALPTSLDIRNQRMAFGPNRLFARDGEHLEAYDTATEGAAHRLWRVPVEKRNYRNLVYAPSGHIFSRTIQSSDEMTAPMVSGWDASSGRRIHVNSSNLNDVSLRTIVAAPDALVALTDTPELIVWPLEALDAPPRRVPLPPLDVDSVHVTADGILLSGNGRTVVRLASLADGAHEVCRWEDRYFECTGGMIIGDHALWVAHEDRRVMRAATGSTATPLLALPLDEGREGWWTEFRLTDIAVRSLPEYPPEEIDKPLFLPSIDRTWGIVGGALVGSLGISGQGIYESDYIAAPLRSE